MVLSLPILSDPAKRDRADAVDESFAVITFEPDGTIVSANANFLSTMGYALDDIRGRPHSMFVDAAEASSAAHSAFWDRLRQGRREVSEFRRLRKAGDVAWLQGAYHPVRDRSGRVTRIMMIAADISERRMREAHLESLREAISRSQAMIVFELDGTIVDANANFLDAMGYSLDEIRGHHHRMFVAEDERTSAGYVAFWDKLRRGEFHSGQYRRFAKGGREIWIQATYNPILDAQGKPYRVVKFASDVTETVRERLRLEDVMRQVAGVVETARRKDLTGRIRIVGEADGSLQVLSSGVNELVEAMTDLVGAVLAASSETTAAFDEIAHGSRNLAARTEQQASALEETAATAEQLAASVKASALASRQAVGFADEARRVAEEGGRIAGEAVDAMTRIEQASGKITEITSVIEEIAFQTNLLALNAAVEAARAGEAGKGFAVVAAEVRTLAQRSSEAARDIGALISSSTREIGQGVRLVRDAGTTLGRIVEASQKVANTVEEISVAATEQASGIDEVSQAVAHMDEMTQQNAALAEASSASAGAVLDQFERLQALAAGYRTDAEPARAAPFRHGARRVA
ncbi:methyl-accepting chemotaxis protein [Alsobacter sp. R-9]